MQPLSLSLLLTSHAFAAGIHVMISAGLHGGYAGLAPDSVSVSGLS